MDGLNKVARISDVVADELRREILSGTLHPGTRLSVEQIAERMGVSRTPVDDGLRRLESEGLIVVLPRRGTFVSEMTARDITETFQIRIALEQLAAQLAVEHAEVGEIRRLRQFLENAPGLADDVLAHSRRNARFHESIVRLSGNARLIGLYTQLYAPILITRAHAGSNAWIERAAQENAEHEAIVHAFERRDVSAAMVAIRSHVERGLGSLIADIDQGRHNEQEREA